jgi:hypothetical protein
MTMEQTILEIDRIKAALAAVAIEPEAVTYYVPSPADAEPRVYTALTVRPADFEGYFAPASRQRVEAVATYNSLTQRPADFVSFFVPPRRKSTEGVANYTALKHHPSAALDDIAA